MKYFIVLSFSIILSGSALAQGQGSGSAIGSKQSGETHVSPAGMGTHPSVQSEATTTTGTNAIPPQTLGQQTSPSSGMTKNRSNDVTGEDTANATQMASDKDQTVPDVNLAAGGIKEAQKSTAIKDNYEVGPYKDGQFSPREQGPEGRQAQEAAQEKEFDLDEETMEKKQQGN